MRNRLIHAYFDINLDRMWEPLKKELPSLIQTLARVLQNEGSRKSGEDPKFR